MTMKLAYPSNRPKLQPALRQVLSARASMACAEVAQHGSAASLFMLRKRAKECRGLMRLLRGGWDEAKDWNAQLRDAAARLAPARDAEVMLTTFDDLTARRRAPADFDSLRAAVLDEIELWNSASDPMALQEFSGMMADFADAAQSARLHGKTAPLVWGNLARTWIKGQRAYCAASMAGEDATAFHTWRKRLKQHWYQARFFKPIDRPALRGHIAQVDRLARTLGAHNDLDVLHIFLRATCTNDPALARLEPDLIAARARFARQALHMGHALYAQPNPTEGWAQAWQVWRKA